MFCRPDEPALLDIPLVYIELDYMLPSTSTLVILQYGTVMLCHFFTASVPSNFSVHVGSVLSYAPVRMV